MKKLVLLLFFTISAKAQITNPTPYSLCDIGIPNFETFDLTTKIPEILGNLSPAENVVTFYPSQQAALTDSGAIVNPAAYVNTIFPIMTLGVRVTNSLGEHSYTTLDLRLLPVPVANPASLVFCEGFALVFYNLNSAIPQITNGISALTVTFYETQLDAETGINPLNGDMYVPLINPGVQTIFARVEFPTTGCFTITTVTLNTNNCNSFPCTAPTQLTASNITDTTFTLSWVNSPNPGAPYNRVSIVPQGEQPSINGIIVAQTANTLNITGLVPNACYSVYVHSACSPTNFSDWSAPLNICLNDCANSGTCSNVLILNAFLDTNNNGIKDAGEYNFHQGNFVYQINDSGDNIYGSSNNGLYYIYNSNAGNSYDISFEVNSTLANYYVSNTVHNNIILSEGSTTHLYFPVTINQSYVDAATFLYPQNAPRPGFTYNVTLTYTNNSFTTIPNGTLTFTKDPNVTISAISETGTTATGTGFTYDFTNLAYNETRFVNVTLQVPTIPTVSLGDLLTNSVTIQVANDAVATNNASSFTQTIVGSYDPNDKAEAHGGKIVFDDFTANDYLYYTIRFENTGTASAEFIRVEDVLDTQLDESTFEMLNASHPVNTRRDGNQLTWHFFDVNLPPSSINSNDGHGYVYFRIKPKMGYAIGDIIPNAASIFFDYNPPIVTEPFITEFVESLGNPSFEYNSVTVYPNPADNYIHVIQNNSQPIKNIVFYDIMGKAIRTISNVSPETTIDTSTLANGLYFLEITDENHLKTVKKLIIR